MIKQTIAAQVTALLSDRSQGHAPVKRSANGLFGPATVTWRVHGDVTSMMVGGIAGLLLQMLHPAVLAGVWDHSNFRTDMHGRLRRTARFIALTTYGDRDAAKSAIARVRAIHDSVRGTLPDGRIYRANDPELLAWVHVTETISFLTAWIRYAEPGMSRQDQDRYFAEMSQIAEALGASPVPNSLSEALDLIDAMRPALIYNQRTREVSNRVMRQRPQSLALAPFQALVLQAAIDCLPPWARQLHDFAQLPFSTPIVRTGTFAAAEMLRWAFR